MKMPGKSRRKISRQSSAIAPKKGVVEMSMTKLGEVGAKVQDTGQRTSSQGSSRIATDHTAINNLKVIPDGE